MPSVILTDETGKATGTMEIVAAHTGIGHLHKAFSVYIFRNRRQEILIQKRSAKKMLWPMIWANTCCSHPHKNESPIEAGQRRMQEECGFTCDLREAGSFVYRAEDPGRGVEHEHVTMLIGDLDKVPSPNPIPNPNPDEIAELKWISVEELRKIMQQNPESYAPWFDIGLKKILERTSE